MSTSDAQGLLEVRITAPDTATAERIATALVEGGLAACVQVLPLVRSTYVWQGDVERAEEHLLLAKTHASRWDALCAQVHATHPYAVPEILAVAATHVDPAYAAWLTEVLGERP